MQWDESEGKGRESNYYGGAGYGGKNSRPDLSNTSYFLETLRETGLPADDPALKKALVFVSRCQNLKGEFNDQPWADKVNDGGFVYTAANSGESMGGKTDNGGLRSYASMTYAGLKSMIYAGLTENDPRVKAAYTYITKHYSVDENPGLGQQGLYYYYHTFAKALAMLGKPTLTDDSGVVHDWRADLVKALTARQNPDGRLGSTPPTASWRVTPTSSLRTACWRWPTPGRSEGRSGKPWNPITDKGQTFRRAIGTHELVVPCGFRPSALCPFALCS